MPAVGGDEDAGKWGRLATRKEFYGEIPVRAVGRGLAPADPLNITTASSKHLRILSLNVLSQPEKNKLSSLPLVRMYKPAIIDKRHNYARSSE